jgi:hypothetical protein
VATNLLLEGDDLEALLLKAHSEGGPHARIVRADKYRHGGLWGFFARERFEVAVEIPEVAALDGSAFFVPGTATAAPAPEPPVATPPVAAAPVAAAPVVAAPVAAARRPGRHAVAPIPARDEALGRATSAALDGLLGLADRVSAVEQASARAVQPSGQLSGQASAAPVQARYADLDPAPVVVVPPGDPEPVHRRIDLARELADIRDRLVVAGVGSRPDSSRRPTSGAPDVPTNSTVSTPMSSSHPAPTGPDGVEPDDTVPRIEPGVRPPTSRPEFTALLDTLREGSRPAGSEPARAPRIPAQASPQASELDEDELPEVGLRQSDRRTAADRRILRALGVPVAWTRLLRPGDRFSEVLRMLERMPVDDIDPATTMVAVVGPATSVRLEAHRTALDLAVGDEPRPVVVVPAAVGTDRAAAVARALRSGPVVLAVEVDGDDPSVVLDTLTTVQAGAVIAVVDAAAPLERTQRWLDALGQVDALVVDGATAVSDPASVLQLGLPVIRLDGIGVDRVTWTALLCAQIVAAETAPAPAPAAADR